METRRKTLSFFLAMAFLTVCGNAWGVEGLKPPGEKPYAEGELLVKFKEGVSEAQIQEVLGQTGTKVTKFLPTLKIHVLKIPSGAAVEDMVKKFQALPEVEYAEPNRVVTIQEKPEKPRQNKSARVKNRPCDGHSKRLHQLPASPGGCRGKIFRPR